MLWCLESAKPWHRTGRLTDLATTCLINSKNSIGPNDGVSREDAERKEFIGVVRLTVFMEKKGVVWCDGSEKPKSTRQEQDCGGRNKSPELFLCFVLSRPVLIAIWPQGSTICLSWNLPEFVRNRKATPD